MARPVLDLQGHFDETCSKSSPANLPSFRTLEQGIQKGLQCYGFMGKTDGWTRAWTRRTRDHVKV